MGGGLPSDGRRGAATTMMRPAPALVGPDHRRRGHVYKRRKWGGAVCRLTEDEELQVLARRRSQDDLGRWRK